MKTHVFEVQSGKMTVDFSVPELAVRMIEVLVGVERPTGTNAVAAMTDLKETAPDLYQSATALAVAALDYFVECIGDSEKGPLS